jgi:hypothetical protein
VLGMKISLGAVRARELSIGIFDGDNSVLRAGSCSLSSRSSGSTGQDSSTTLRSNNVSGLIAFLKDGVGLHEGTRAVGRGHAGLGHNATGGHGAKNWRSTTSRRRGSNRLRVRHGRGSLRHHTSRCGIALVRVRVLGHGIHPRTVARLRSLLLVARQILGWSIWGTRSSRRMRVASVERLHGNGMGLQRRERLRQRRTSLKLVRRDGRGRWVCLSSRCVYTIGRVLRAVHNPAKRRVERGDVCYDCFFLFFTTSREGETVASRGGGIGDRSMTNGFRQKY